MQSLVSRSAAALPFVALFVASATGCPATDEPRQRSRERAEQAEQRSLVDRFYLVSRQDFRKCVAPLCGGVYVAEVNHATSGCFGGSEEPDCYVGGIDWSALDLSEAELAELPGRAVAGQVLVRGRLEPYASEYPVAKLVPTAAWLAATDAAPAGSFYQVKDSGIVCITYPCGSLSELLLNEGGVANIHGLDLTTSGATDGQLGLAQNAVAGGGLMVAGTHHDIHGPGGTGTELRASTFYLPVGVEQGEACGDVVCAAGDICCNASCNQCTKPDMVCIQLACDDGCGHSECSQGTALESACSDCAAAVCAEDAFCCESSWDGLCVKEAESLCADTCAPPPPPACVHSECDAGAALDGACSTCAAAVCGSDAFCCATEWDSLCAKEAAELCADTCAPAGCAHDECAAGGTLDAACSPCATSVCDADDYCCSTEWDDLCVSEAAELCGC
jgi:hypothetical protein